MGLAGFDWVGADFKGRSVVDLPDDRVLFLTCFSDRRCLARIEGHEKYIHFFDDQPDAIYDLNADPLEQSNRASDRMGLLRSRQRPGV